MNQTSVIWEEIKAALLHVTEISKMAFGDNRIIGEKRSRNKLAVIVSRSLVVKKKETILVCVFYLLTCSF